MKAEVSCSTSLVGRPVACVAFPELAIAVQPSALIRLAILRVE